MKSLIAFATNALSTVGSTAAGKAVIIATTVAVTGTSTAGVASMTAQQNKASEVQTEAVAEVDESVAADADVMAIDDMNVSAAASDVVPDATIATEDNPVIGHRICFCGAGVAILEKTGLDEAVWAWHILEAHGVKYDKFHNVRHTDAYGDDDPFMEYVTDPVKKPGQEEADKPEAEEPVKKPEVDAPVVDNGNVNKPVEDNKVEVENDADKKAEEEAKKKAEEEAKKKAEEEAKKKAEEEAKKKAEEEAKKKAEEEARKKAEEEARKKAEEEAAKKAAEEAAKKAEEDRLIQEAIDASAKVEQWILEGMKNAEKAVEQNVEVSGPAVQ